MRTDDFDYLLPQELIAQTPADPRDSSRLLVLDRAADTLAHRRFNEIGDYLRPGDLLVSITADLGSIAVVPVLHKPAYVSQHIALCRPTAGVHPRWLGYAMVSPQAKRQLMSSGYGGTKIQLSLDDVRNVWLAVPPLDEQVEIADFLDLRLSKIARQITLIDQLDDLLQQQRKAIIHEAVTGKIDLSSAILE